MKRAGTCGGLGEVKMTSVVGSGEGFAMGGGGQAVFNLLYSVHF